MFWLEQLKDAAPKYAELIPDAPDLIRNGIEAMQQQNALLKQQQKEIASLRRTLVDTSIGKAQIMVGIGLIVSAFIAYGLDGRQPEIFMWGAPFASWILGGIGAALLISTKK